MSEAPELLPCPFCGGAANTSPDSEHSTAFTLTHHSKGCPIDDLWDWYPDEKQAVAAWNTRTDLVQSQIDAAVQEEREACAELVSALETSCVDRSVQMWAKDRAEAIRARGDTDALSEQEKDDE